MKFGYSLIFADYVEAKDLDYKDTTEFLMVCPVCKEPIRKVERIVKSRDDITEYLAHFKKNEFTDECELRVSGMNLKDLQNQASINRGQTLQKFLKRFKTLWDEAMLARYVEVCEEFNDSPDTALIGFTEDKKTVIKYKRSYLKLVLGYAKYGDKELALDIVREIITSNLETEKKSPVFIERMIKVSVEMFNFVNAQIDKNSDFFLYIYGWALITSCSGCIVKLGKDADWDDKMAKFEDSPEREEINKKARHIAQNVMKGIHYRKPQYIKDLVDRYYAERENGNKAEVFIIEESIRVFSVTLIQRFLEILYSIPLGKLWQEYDARKKYFSTVERLSKQEFKTMEKQL